MRELPVYVVHWNAPDWVASSVASLMASDIPIRVTVIDNGPPGVGLTLPASVRVLGMPDNLGYAGGANAALEHWLGATDAPLAVVCSHDLHVQPATLGMLRRVMEQHPGLGVVGPGVTPGGKGDQVGSRGGLELRTWVSGACLMLRRSCARQVGSFDRDFESYVEDVDYCLRAAEAGWQVGRLPAARAHGLGSRSSSADLDIQKNWLVLAWKRGGAAGLVRSAASDGRRFVRHAVLSLTPVAARAEHARRARVLGGGLARGLRRVVQLRRRRAGTPSGTG